jgi:hypothetical protein
MNSFQELLKENMLASLEFSNTSVVMLQRHKMACQLAEKGKLDYAMQVMEKTTEVVDKLVKTSTSLALKAESLGTRVTEVLVLASQDEEKVNSVQSEKEMARMTVAIFGKIKTVFENVRLYWKQAEGYCSFLEDIEVLRVFSEVDLKLEFLEKIKDSRLNCLAMGHFGEKTRKSIEIVDREFDKLMSDLP